MSGRAANADPDRYAAIIAAPGFCIGVVCADDCIAGIDFLEPCAEQTADTPLAHEAARQLRAWLKDPAWVFNLPLAPAGTPFRRRVWAQIGAIPGGETRSYGDIAKMLHSAPRAVGGACGANPYPIVVPCHRVVSARGGFNAGLGGFAHQRGGFLLDVKRWLLAHERR
ncbi:MAG: methylated-DNA--[protein]-cysteine S-methyltransferase [Rhodocyclaceae bacterium]|nr:methylated-DNA--[protein]-cysteine S-methyltransferase [Rhodocyclaceae bacterium]